MKTIEIAFTLTLVVFATANPHPGLTKEQANESDAELGRAVIECAREALVTGIPEVGIVSYNPYKSRTSYFESSIGLLGLWSSGYSVQDVVIEGIPFWEVTQFDELISNNIFDVFKYTISWKKVVFKANWTYNLRFLDFETQNEGAATVELDNVSISGIFIFTKPGSGSTETISDLKVHVTAQGGQLDFTNLGALGDKIHDYSNTIISYMLNDLDVAKVSEEFKDVLINDWIQRPDRIDAIIARCQK